MNDNSNMDRVRHIMDAAVDVSYKKAVCVSSKHGEVNFSHVCAVGESACFDLASISKILTVSFIMHLITLGSFSASESYMEVLERECRSGNPGDAFPHRYSFSDRSLERLSRITIEDLLFHRSGITEWYPFYAGKGFMETLDMVLSCTEEVEGYAYSDIGFMLLGLLAEAAAGKSLPEQLSELNAMLGTGFMYDPESGMDIVETEMGNRVEMGMCRERSLEFNPWEGLRTSWRSTDVAIKGKVNDGNCFYAMGGVSGHAGVFGRASDLIALGNMYINGGGTPGGSYIDRETCSYAMRPDSSGRTPGFDAGEVFAPGIGHTGFTGTALYINQSTGVCSVLLTNRLMIDGDAPPNIQGLRREIFGLLDPER